MPATADALGIPQLDALLSPVPVGSTVLIANDPGIEAESFLYQAAHSQLAAGRTVVYAVFNRPPSAVARAMNEFGFDTAPHAGRFLLLDAYSPLLGTRDPAAAYQLKNPLSLNEFGLLLESVSREHRDAVLIIDPLSNLVDVLSVPHFVRQFPLLRQTIAHFRLTIALFTQWPYPGDVSAALQAFDVVVACKGVEDRVLFGQYFSLQRARWKPGLSTRPQLYKTHKPGGVHVYVPKIVVTGAHTAGKTTFIHSVSDTAKSANFEGSTVALDHGNARIDGLTVDLFGTPGQERFDPILGTIAGQALGIILMVDSTRPETFGRAREMLGKIYTEGLPVIVCANKQDVPGALTAEDVERELRPPPNIQVVGCRAAERASAQAVLRSLLERILKTGVSV